MIVGRTVASMPRPERANPVTNEQASAEAKRRWGAKGCVQQSQPRPVNTHFVGYQDGHFTWMIGHGQSWEEAFAAADKWPLDTIRHQLR